MAQSLLFNGTENLTEEPVVHFVPFLMLKSWCSDNINSTDTNTKMLSRVVNCIKLLELNFKWEEYELYPLFWEMLKSIIFSGKGAICFENYFNNAYIRKPT